MRISISKSAGIGLSCWFVLASPVVARARRSGARTAYTALTEASCQTTSVDAEGSSSTQLCSGVLGYKLIVTDGDSRMSVTIVSPNGSRHPLAFEQTVTPHFSALGKRAAWRIRGQRPVVIVLPLDAQQDPDAFDVTTHFLVVARISPLPICVVSVLIAGRDTLRQARLTADGDKQATCIAVR